MVTGSATYREKGIARKKIVGKKLLYIVVYFCLARNTLTSGAEILFHFRA